MGEVYRAHDERLDRRVAIKVIAERLLNDEHARERFEREARAIAALSHPYICTVYDVGSVDGIEFLVMEYLEGETLADRLARQGKGKPLPAGEVLRIAIELGDALTAAHSASVIHRDLKPANVMLSKTDSARRAAPQVKVLDFGLAKLTVLPSTADVSRHGPLTSIETRIGTIPYMSPEQLEGRALDARTDLFALGAIVYEMASGRRPFTGDSDASLIAAILARDPEPPSSIQPTLPRELDDVIRRCLAKDPRARWESASQVAEELRKIGSEGWTPAPRARDRRRIAPIAIALAGSVLVAAIAGIWGWRKVAGGATPPIQHRQVTFNGDVTVAALSPDGRTIAYATGDRGVEVRLVVRDLAGGEPLPIWRGRDIFDCVWLPDGSHVVVKGAQDGTVYFRSWIVPRLGGTPRMTAGLVPSPDGSALASFVHNIQGFVVWDLRDGSSRSVALTGFRWSQSIDWHPRTNRVILLSSDDDGNESIWSAAPDGAEQTLLYTGKDSIHAICSSPISADVYALRQRGNTRDLIGVPTDGGRGPVRVLSTGLPFVGAPSGFRGRCTVSADGRRLLYRRGTSEGNLWRFEVSAKGGEARPVTQGTRQLANPRVSPDGQWIVAEERGSDPDSRLVKIPIDGGEPVHLGEGDSPAWSPDGRRLAFVSSRGGARSVWVIDPNLVRKSFEVVDSAVEYEVTWLPDGRLAWRTPDGRNYRIRDLRSGRDEYLFKDTPFSWPISPRFSANGQHVAFSLNRAKAGHGLWLLSWPGRDERRLLSGRIVPIGWSADDQWIYTVAVDGRSVFRVSAQTGQVEEIGRFPRGTLDFNSCDLTPDRGAVICGLTEETSDAWIMENFDPQVS